MVKRNITIATALFINIHQVPDNIISVYFKCKEQKVCLERNVHKRHKIEFVSKQKRNNISKRSRKNHNKQWKQNSFRSFCFLQKSNKDNYNCRHIYNGKICKVYKHSRSIYTLDDCKTIKGCKLNLFVKEMIYICCCHHYCYGN